MSLNEIFLISPAISLSLFSFIPLFIKMFLKKEVHKNILLFFCFLGIFVSIYFSLIIPLKDQFAFSNYVSFSPLSFFGIILILISLFFTLIFSTKDILVDKRYFSEFLFLLMNTASAMMLFVQSNHLIGAFISMEFLSLGLYLLIGMGKGCLLSKEACLKYFILGSFASCFFLYGISFIFGSSSSVFLSSIDGSLISHPKLFLLGISFLLSAGLFKLSLFPFYSWVAEIYKGAPTSITAFMGSAVKASFVIFLFKLLRVDYDFPQSFTGLLSFLLVFSIIIGNLLPLTQNSVKKIIAFSGIAQTAYLFIPAISFSAIFSKMSLIYYLMVYSLMVLIVFGSMIYLENLFKRRILIEDLKGLFYQNPVLSLILSLNLLSLAGIPPFAGFWAKLFSFSAAWDHQLYFLIFWALIGSVIGLYYYLKPISLMFQEVKDKKNNALKLNSLSIALCFLSIILVLSALFSGGLYVFIQECFNM